MPIVRMVSPRDVTYEIYQQVSAKLGVDNDPPEGLILHTASEVDGQLKVVDVWESPEAFQAFADEKIGPLTAEAGLAPPLIEQGVVLNTLS